MAKSKARPPRHSSRAGESANKNNSEAVRPAPRHLLSVLSALASTTPYTIGVLFSWFPIRRVYFDPFLERAFYFITLFCLWQLVLWIMLRWYAPLRNSTTSRLRSITTLAALVLASLAFLLVLQFFRARLLDQHFYVALFALGGIGLQRAYQFRQQLLGAAVGRFCAVTSVSYLSFLIVDPAIKWEPLIPCAALACMFIGRDLAQHLHHEAGESSNPPLPLAKYKLISRGAAVAFILGPTLVSSLCYFGKLPTSFIFLFAICPLLLPLADQLRKGEETGEAPPSIGWRSQVIFVAYAAILHAVGLMGRLS